MEETGNEKVSKPGDAAKIIVELRLRRSARTSIEAMGVEEKDAERRDARELHAEKMTSKSESV